MRLRIGTQGAQGLPLQVALSRSSGYSRLDEQALWAMRQARFRPYTEDGRAIEIDEDTETRPGSLEVMEASHSLFDEMEKSWTGQVPLDAANSPARG